MKRETANATFLCRLALIFQRALDDVPPHPVDERMRTQAWRWWSEAQQMGVVVQ